MATLRAPVEIVKPDSTVPIDLVSNQITAAAAPSIGNLLAYILADGGTDEGVYVRWSVPQNYVGTPKIAVRGVLDGAPAAATTIGFGCRPRAVANNEVGDGTFDAEQVVSATIGSNGSGHGDEDFCEQLITLTGTYAAGDEVFAYVYIDASGGDYAGNFLLTSIEFQYADA